MTTADCSCASAPARAAIAPLRAAELSSLLAALADPVRLQIYSLVVEAGELCACDLEAPTGRSQPTISHHTARLARSGLLVGEKRGRWTWWRADDAGAAALAEAIRSLLPLEED